MRLLLFAALCSAFLSSFAQTTTVYACNFESNCDTLEPISTGQWEIGIPSNVPFFSQVYSGTNALVTGADQLPSRNGRGYYEIRVPNFYHSIVISFKHRRDFGQGKSGGYLTFSFDSGTTWVNAANLNQAFHGEYFYTSGLYDTLKPINNIACFSGSDLSWMETSITLINYIPVLKPNPGSEKEYYPWGNEQLLMRFNYFIGPEVTNLAGWCIDDLQVEATVGGGIETFKKDHFIRIWPVPFSENLNIEITNNDQIRSITLSDISGKPILSKPEPAKYLELGFLPKGIYFLTVETRDGKWTRQILK